MLSSPMQNSFPALALRQLVEPELPRSPAQNNLLAPHPIQNRVPALALRHLVEPEIPLPPPRTI